MSTYDEANDAYQFALAELERLKAAAEAEPENTVLAVELQAAYTAAQVTYDELLVAIDVANGVTVQPAAAAAVISDPPVVTAPAMGSGYDLSPSGIQSPVGVAPISAAPGNAAPVGYVPSSAPPTGVEKFGPLPSSSHADFGSANSASAPRGFVLTRPTPTTRFTPSEVLLEDLVPIQRGLLAPAPSSAKTELGRARTIAGSLPAWSPLPPGEIVALGRKR